MASVIIPATGERIRSVFTFNRGRRGGRQDGGAHDDIEAEQEMPLLAHRRRTSTSSTALRLSQMRIKTRKFTDWLLRNKAHLVFKCSIAYLIGSMATFAGPIAALLGKSGGKHLVATC